MERRKRREKRRRRRRRKRRRKKRRKRKRRRRRRKRTKREERMDSSIYIQHRTHTYVHATCSSVANDGDVNTLKDRSMNKKWTIPGSNIEKVWLSQVPKTQGEDIRYKGKATSSVKYVYTHMAH